MKCRCLHPLQTKNSRTNHLGFFIYGIYLHLHIKEEDEKKSKIALKKQIEKTKKAPARNCIVSAIISLFAFLLGWIPFWLNMTLKVANEGALRDWIALGHSESDDFGQECLDNIAIYSARAASVLWISFVVLFIGIIICVMVFIMSKRKAPDRVAKLEEELNKLK